MIRKLSMIALLVGLVFLVGCGGKEEKADGKEIIRVAHFPNITHSQALVGLANGTFEKAMGTDVKIERKVFNAGPAEIEALLAGEVDLGYIGPVPAVNGFAKSNGLLKVVAGATNAGAVLVVGKDSGIKDIKDLAGKRVAIPQLGNTQDISLRNLLLENGLKSKDKGGDVQVFAVENPDILALFTKKELDAALVPEPWGTRLVKQGNGKILLDYNQVWREGNYTTVVVIVSTKFLEEHPDLVEKWLAAHVELTQYIKDNPEEAKKLINEQLKVLTNKSLPTDILDEAFARMTPTYDPVTDSVKEFVEISYEAGHLKKKPDVNQLFALDYLNKNLKAKGLPEVK
ncbi:MAG: aliphatic sulfonate ABC transporter substrate-binding protein [Thermincolia bacterium]